MQVEMVAEGKTASRHLEMSKEICPQSFPSLDAFRVFAKNTRLLIPPPSPPSFVRQDACVFKNKVRRNKYNNFMFHDKLKMSILFSRILMNICYSYTFNYIIINFCQIVLATV